MNHHRAEPAGFDTGDTFGLAMPARPEVFAQAGAGFLTRAFHAFGTLPPDNAVARIVRMERCIGGSTGKKLFLDVEYARPDPALDTGLFVKFSRDFDDAIRDVQRHEMRSEVRLGRLSRHPAFPIAVPRTYFADWHEASESGLLITGRVRYGEGEIEPQRIKCMDHELADPLEYYRAILTALARLAAAHKSGRLSAEVEEAFPFDAGAAIAEDRIPYDPAGLTARLAQFSDLAGRAPRLFPANIVAPEFIARLNRDALRVLEHEQRIKRFLHADPDFIALCHWNANIDNAWFWRDRAGALHCGLIDWGRVRQLNLAYALWGCLLAAPLAVWDKHLDELLALFASELAAGGGPRLRPEELKLHLRLYVAQVGLALAIVAPERIVQRLPEAVDASGPRDPVFARSEPARNFLHVFTVFLNFWETHDLGGSLDLMLERA